MDQSGPMTRIMHCKVEIENTNFQSESYIKEEIMIPGMTESFDDEASSALSNTLQADKIPFWSLDKDESKLIHKQQIFNLDNSNSDEEIDVVNVDERNEKLFIETHKNKSILGCKGLNNIDQKNFDKNIIRINECRVKIERDATLDKKSLLLLRKFDYSDGCQENGKMYTPKRTREIGNFQVDINDKGKENITLDKRIRNKSRGQMTVFNLFKKPSRGSSKLTPITSNNTIVVVDKGAAKTIPKAIKSKKDKHNAVILVCPKCSRKEKAFSIDRRTNCQDCKNLMNYVCLICGDRMKTIKSLQCHIGKKCKRQHKTYKCQECNYQNTNERLFRKHVYRRHVNEQECPKCDKKLSKETLRKHMEGCGINVYYLRCKFCSFNSKYKDNLLAHIRITHTDVKAHQLGAIVKQITKEGEKIKANALNSADASKVNMLSISADYKKFIQLYCTDCDVICGDADYRNERDCRKCGAAKLLQCVKCAKRYRTVSSIYVHLRYKCAARNYYQCTHCDYTSTRKKCLANHIDRRHTVVAPGDYESCSKCNKRFRYPLDRVSHEKRCSSKAKDKTHANVHMQDHVLHSTVDNVTIPVPAYDVPVKSKK